MSEALATAAPIGHNSLIAFYAEQNAALPGYLLREHQSLLDAQARLTVEFETAPSIVDTDDIERTMTDLGGRLQKLLKEVGVHKKAVKEPAAAGTKIIDDFFNRLVKPLDDAKAVLERRINSYKDEKRAAAERQRQAAERAAREAAEEARRKQEEAARLAEEEDRARREQTTLADDEATRAAAQDRIAAEQEATRAAMQAREAAAVASAKPAAPAKVVGDSGAVSIQRMSWTSEITDLEALDLNALRPFIPRAALETALRGYVQLHKNTKPIAGAHIYQKTTTAFR